jgi:hypothetical protein
MWEYVNAGAMLFGFRKDALEVGERWIRISEGAGDRVFGRRGTGQYDAERHERITLLGLTEEVFTPFQPANIKVALKFPYC